MTSWTTLAYEGYKIADKLGLWGAVCALLRRKKTILLLGASGVGKTQFIDSLRDPIPTPVAQRTAAPHARKARIQKHPFSIIDTPGQRFDEAKRKPAIARALGDGVEGVINVVCFGYHEAAEAGREQAVPGKGSSIARAAYLRERQKIEVDLLSEWAPLLDAKSTRWVLTVVNKADLWWPDEAKIRDHYERGAYSARLTHVEAHHLVLPYCSIISPFFGTRTSGRFGDSHRLALRVHLLENILQSIGIER